jgi:protein involved in polysaccharide export with SLBB domain
MDPKHDDRRRRYRRARSSCALLIGLTFASSGCVTSRERIAEAMASKAPAPVLREQTVEEGYRIACPDVVEITLDGMPELSGEYPVTTEGRIELAAFGNPRIEGQTSSSLVEFLAVELRLPAERIHCKVASHRSRVVFVHGPIEGGERIEVYRGPENVVAFLRRCGGLSSGADVCDVHVIRGNVASGAKPQVFRVDLEAILLRGDARTNVLLQPFDEICVGELPRSRIGKTLPGWLRPFFHGFCDLAPGLCPQTKWKPSGEPEP